MSTRTFPLRLLSLITLASVCLHAQEPARDPTSVSFDIADSLRAQMAEFRTLGIRALVVGSQSDSGVALLSVPATDAPTHPALVRSGTSLAVTFHSIPVSLHIASVAPEGVSIDAPTLEEHLLIPASLRPLPAPSTPPAPSYLRHLECSELPLRTLLNLIADQTGVNITASEQAAQQTISITLRNVSPEQAVSEICRARGLWYRHDSDSAILRITTMAEFESGLSSLSEQLSECFTLLYPNVIEAASILYGLYPDRVLLSMGEDDILDAELNDLDRRVDRFNAFGNSTSSSFLSKSPGLLSSSVGSRTVDGFKRASREAADLEEDLSQTRAPDSTPPALPSDQAVTETLQRNRRAASGIYITVSRRNNLLLVRTSDTQAMDEIRDLIRRIDVPTPMVLLEMKILNISLGDGYDASMLWGYATEKGDTQYSVSYPATPSFESTLQSGAMNFARIGKRLSANLHWLETQNRVTVMASPSLLVANNEVSRIFRGQSRPLVRDISATSTTTDTGITTVSYDTQIEWNDVGTMIVVTPSINADRSVTLRLLHEESSVDAEKARIPISSAQGESGLEYAEVDILDSRSITGTFVAQDNEPVAIGGLITETTEKVVSRIPFLGRIPLLGFLFRSTKLVKNRSELVILVTPHVISTPADGAAISAQVLERISKAQPVLDRVELEENDAHAIDKTLLSLPTAPQDFDPAAPVDFEPAPAP